MGRLVEGKWQEDYAAVTSGDGRFVRAEASFRDFVTADGSSGFPAEAGRYHLYVSLACPWAHRTMIFRALLGLDGVISASIVDPLMGPGGWHFSDGPGCIPDTVNNAQFMHEVYLKADPGCSTRVTVPVLWDKVRQTIVNNESSEIIRMLNTAFRRFQPDGATDYCPAELYDDIELVNERVYRDVNNGVYRCGFASTQQAYDVAFGALFSTLDWLESRLGEQRYLCGDRLTEADWRLFTTLVRFDAVYVGHFKCNLRRISDYPHLYNYLRDLYQIPGVAETCNFQHIKEHYYRSHISINPSGIVPLGPDLDFDSPHNRGNFPVQ